MSSNQFSSVSLHKSIIFTSSQLCSTASCINSCRRKVRTRVCPPTMPLINCSSSAVRIGTRSRKTCLPASAYICCSSGSSSMEKRCSGYRISASIGRLPTPMRTCRKSSSVLWRSHRRSRSCGNCNTTRNSGSFVLSRYSSCSHSCLISISF